MLPSMPVLFSRESQDAFGNKIEPSTSFFNQNSFPKAINPEPPPAKAVIVAKQPAKENKKSTAKKKQDPPKLDYNNALVKAYYTKVQSKFASHQSVPTNKFVQFQNILRTYNPKKETPVDLYRKIESLFKTEHPELVEEFLLFLTPGQASTVGRFMDRFALIQMTSFIQLLQSTFARKPTVLRKILRSISTSIKIGSSVEMKTRVLPHLRSSPKLIQMYKALFPDERPPESCSESDVTSLKESVMKCDTGCDYWEIKDEKDGKKQKNDGETTRLHTMYHHGRIFLKHGRMVRAACVTYPFSKEPYRVHLRRLTSASHYTSPTESEDETTTNKRRNTAKMPPKRNKKQTKSPTKNVKDVNDNNKHKDSINSPKAKGKSNAKSRTVKDKKDSDSKIELQKVNKKDKSDIKKNLETKDDIKLKQSKSDKLVNSVALKKDRHDSKSSIDENAKSKQESSQSKNKTSNGQMKSCTENKIMAEDEELNIKVLKNKQEKPESIKITIIKNELKEKVIKNKIVDESNDEAILKKPRVESGNLLEIKQSLDEIKIVESKIKTVDPIVEILDDVCIDTKQIEDNKKTSIDHTNHLNFDKNKPIVEQGVKTESIDKTASILKSSWTRDEDKTILQILKGEAGSDQIFGRIHDLLPHRSVSEIRERFCQVMSVLQKMAVGEVT